MASKLEVYGWEVENLLRQNSPHELGVKENRILVGGYGFWDIGTNGETHPTSCKLDIFGGRSF